jgi:hypothetical protein
MNFRKRTYVYLAVCIIGFCAWGISFWNVNHKFPYKICGAYKTGDTFTENDCEISVNSAEVMTTEQLAAACENLSVEDIEEWGYTDCNYFVADVDVTNLTGKEIDSNVYLWILNCGGYGNGCSFLTDLNTPEVRSLAAGETANVQLIFAVTEKGMQEMKKYPVKLYTSLYPEVRYITYE